MIEQDFNVEITKKELLKEICNEMCHNYYFLIHGKIYNKDHSRYRKFKFVEMFDIFDLQEWYEKETITKNDIRDYVSEIAFANTLYIRNYDNTSDFYKFCDETIKKYNETNKNCFCW